MGVFNTSRAVKTGGRSYRKTGSLELLKRDKWNGVKCGFHMFEVFNSIPDITMSPSSYSSPHQPPLTYSEMTLA